MGRMFPVICERHDRLQHVSGVGGTLVGSPLTGLENPTDATTATANTVAARRTVGGDAAIVRPSRG
ncbi:MAG: hypothetical protein R3E72_05420 [Steroidobacteraceae bacterium]